MGVKILQNPTSINIIYMSIYIFTSFILKRERNLEIVKSPGIFLKNGNNILFLDWYNEQRNHSCKVIMNRQPVFLLFAYVLLFSYPFPQSNKTKIECGNSRKQKLRYLYTCAEHVLLRWSKVSSSYPFHSPKKYEKNVPTKQKVELDISTFHIHCFLTLHLFGAFATCTQGFYVFFESIQKELPSSSGHEAYPTKKHNSFYFHVTFQLKPRLNK